MCYEREKNVVKIISKIMFYMLFLVNNVFAQLELEVSTDKDSYSYGESIRITCAVTNVTDSTFRTMASCTDSWQAEFEFNDYYSLNWSFCLTLVQELVFLPYCVREYTWVIDPERFGLPDNEGAQRIVGHFFYNNITDTTYINAPMFLGGQLNVGFTTQNDSLLIQLKDSLNAEVLSRIVFSTLNTISETWQVYGIQLDSLYKFLDSDNRITWVEYERSIMYESITSISEDDKTSSINNYYLSEAFPNPFNSTSRFYLEISNTENVNIALFNILGEKISSIYNDVIEKNRRYNFEIGGNNLPGGVYFLVVNSRSFYKSKKIILLK